MVSQALSEFFGKCDYIKAKESKEREARIPDLLEALIKMRYGKEWLQLVFKTEKETGNKEGKSRKVVLD